MERELLKRRTQRLAKVLVVLVALVFVAFLTLDVVYSHVFFSAENADVASVVLLLAVLVATFLLLFIQQREKRMQPSSITQKEHIDKLPS